MRAVEEVNQRMIGTITYQCKITHSLQVHIFAMKHQTGRSSVSPTPVYPSSGNGSFPMNRIPAMQEQSGMYSGTTTERYASSAMPLSTYESVGLPFRSTAEMSYPVNNTVAAASPSSMIHSNNLGGLETSSFSLPFPNNQMLNSREPSYSSYGNFPVAITTSSTNFTSIGNDGSSNDPVTQGTVPSNIFNWSSSSLPGELPSSKEDRSDHEYR